MSRACFEALWSCARAKNECKKWTVCVCALGFEAPFLKEAQAEEELVINLTLMFIIPPAYITVSTPESGMTSVPQFAALVRGYELCKVCCLRKSLISLVPRWAAQLNACENN